MACAMGLGSKGGLLDQEGLRGLVIKNTFIEFNDSELRSGDSWSRQISEPAAPRDFCRQFSGPAAPHNWSGKDDEEVSRQTSPITTDEYPGISDVVTDDEVPSTGPPSPRSPYSPGSRSPSATSPFWAESWVEHGSNSFRPPLEARAFPGMPPFDSAFVPMSEGMLSPWGGCASNSASNNMVTLRGVPEDYTMNMLVAEFCNAGFQKGRDFLSVHLPMSAQGMTNSGFCVVTFAKTSARNEFMGAFQGRAMRYSASALPVAAAPSTLIEVMLATQEALREASSAVRRCPECNCQVEPGFKFCTQCGVSLQGPGAAGSWTPQQQQQQQQRPR